MPAKAQTSRAANALRRKLTGLREKRKRMKTRGSTRRGLSVSQRKAVLAKTGGRCHICGGQVESGWQADHVNSHAMGGEHAEANYLAAHALCNNYRWHYLPEEFQYVMKIGVWARTQIERGTPIGLQLADKFATHESRRERRRV